MRDENRKENGCAAARKEVGRERCRDVWKEAAERVCYTHFSSSHTRLAARVETHSGDAHAAGREVLVKRCSSDTVAPVCFVFGVFNTLPFLELKVRA